MNAPTKIQPTIYAIPNAFDASGYIAANRGPLQLLRAQWNQTFADMEDTIRVEMEEEASIIRRKSVPARWPSHAELEAQKTMRRAAREEHILGILDCRPMTREELEKWAGIRGGAFRHLLRDMMRDGLIKATPTGPNRAWVYEVSQ